MPWHLAWDIDQYGGGVESVDETYTEREMSATKGLRILIAGAGIAGLAFANALSKKGIRATLVEAGQTLEAFGLGLALQANGVRALEHIGLGDAVITAGIRTQRMVTTDAAENPLRTMDVTTAGPTVAIHRKALIEVLSQGLDVDLRLATTVAEISITGEMAKVRLSDGSEGEYDLVVGADGLRSSLRQRLFPDASFRYRGYRAWRTLVPRAPDDPSDAVLRWGRGTGFGTFPVSNDWLYAFVLESGPDVWSSASGYVGHIRRIAEGFGPVARSVADRVTDGTTAIYTPVYEVSMECWRAGPVVLIGDAAHAIVPLLAQGAALAIEDAVLLAEAFDFSTDVATSIARYETARRPRIDEAAAICGFVSIAVGLEGPPDPEVLRVHPGNPARFASASEPQTRLWTEFDRSLKAFRAS